ncbi:MAG: fumarate hydratase, partial [Crenarchaeota archaeon]|nr:fumarate hydratase [Thermoproteota archaeon]
MTKYKLKTPLKEEDIRKLKVNDVVYLSGVIVTARDQAHKRALNLHKANIPLPVEVKDLAIYHCGPVVKKQKDNKWI